MRYQKLYILLLARCLPIILVTAPSTLGDSPLRPKTSPKALNILFITVDSLRADKLSCYGFRKKTSPSIDKLCEEGIVFSNAYASSGWTSPSLVSIFSSLHPTSHGIEVRGFVLNRNIRTPVEILAEKGWRTYGQHASGDTIGNIGFQQADGDVKDFLEKIKDEKFFAWYHLRTPHLPYDPPEEYVLQFSEGLTADLGKLQPLREKKMIVKDKDVLEIGDRERKFTEILYEADVRYQDDEIKQIIETLMRLNLWNRTIVVLTSDHGEELFEHGWVGHASTSLDGNLYEEILRIPLIIRFPGMKKRAVVRTPVTHVDIMPILFLLLGMKPEFETDSDVVDVRFSPQTGEIEVTRGSEFIFASSTPCGWQCKDEDKWKRIYVVQEGRWKLVYRNYRGSRAHEEFELFLLPDEKHNMAARNPERLSHMMEILFKVLKKSKFRQALFPPEVYSPAGLPE